MEKEKDAKVIPREASAPPPARFPLYYCCAHPEEFHQTVRAVLYMHFAVFSRPDDAKVCASFYGRHIDAPRRASASRKRTAAVGDAHASLYRHLIHEICEENRIVRPQIRESREVFYFFIELPGNLRHRDVADYAYRARLTASLCVT